MHIWATVTSPDAKTIAFGGVETGIIKARLAAMVVGITNSNGSSPKPLATAAKMGRSVAVQEILLVNWVIKTDVVLTSNIITGRERF
ncbi:unnamed protein product [marine sediment metagenome]|uniref:Uncharacterized protein n=1 Tax=marine sediment metagenome TaxID=412755 RepID=X0SC75_9ZZZZ